MSHQPERKEKDCLNCGTTVAGRFCQNCGQENVVTQQSAFALVKHFIYDIFHFDGKFFDTLKYLFFKPGYVPYHYVRGKRNSFLDPIRMYLFTSAVFFIVFFSINKIPDSFSNRMSRAQRYEQAGAAFQAYKINPSDSLSFKKLDFLLDTTKQIKIKSARDTQGEYIVRIRDEEYVMIPKTDSSFTKYVNSDNWLERKFLSKWLSLNRKYEYDEGKVLAGLGDDFLHKLPYILFISLPLFSLLLKLLYKRKKELYYSDHTVFTLYHYIFTFILLLLYFAFSQLNDISGWRVFTWLNFGLLSWAALCLYLSMKRFYAQGWGKTLIKFILLDLMGIFMLFFLFIIVFIITILF